MILQRLHLAFDPHKDDLISYCGNQLKWWSTKMKNVTVVEVFCRHERFFVSVLTTVFGFGFWYTPLALGSPLATTN